jgi:transposase
MAHLHKKIKRGRPYYYVREVQRIKGKPTVVNQVYLGSADRILEVFLGKNREALPRGFSSKEFGSVFVMDRIDREVDIGGVVDGVLGRRRRTRGPSCGDLFYYAVLNRAISPRSKRQLSSWYERTDIQSIRPLRLEALSPQNFWNHWERVGEEELERIVDGFFQRVQALGKSDRGHFLFDTTNFYTYVDSRTPSELLKRGRNKAGKHRLRQVGFALITQRETGLPVYYRIYPGNHHDSRFFGEHLEEILEKLKSMEGDRLELTLIFDKGMNSEAAIQRIDSEPHLHFITSYSPYFAKELASIPLKHFRPLDTNSQVLYLETTWELWGKKRKVLITFNPATFRKKHYELKEKLQRLRQELYELRRKYREQDPHWRSRQAVKDHYQRLCERWHLSPAFFNLEFYTQGGRPQMAFKLNRYQIEAHLRRMAKTIVVTDHQDWSPQEIHQAYTDRHVIEGQFRKAKSPFQVAFMPQYHWTDSKIRIHAFICVAALTYLTVLKTRLAKAGITLSASSLMEELRSLRTAIYWMPTERKARRILEEPTPTQLCILQALGYQVKDGWVVQS